LTKKKKEPNIFIEGDKIMPAKKAPAKAAAKKTTTKAKAKKTTKK
jgi:hypothetical protein